MAVSQQQERLEEELYQICEATNDDGTVDVTIDEWEKSGERVIVHFKTATLKNKAESLRWPERDSDEYKFVRICRECGLSFSAALELDGSKIRANPETWNIIAPKRETRRERFTNYVHGANFADKVVGTMGTLLSIGIILTTSLFVNIGIMPPLIIRVILGISTVLAGIWLMGQFLILMNPSEP